MTKSRRLQAATVFATAVRLGLGILLLYSGLLKLRHPQQFLSSVYSYQLVGREAGKAIAIAVPFLELTIGGCLICGIYVGGALIGSFLLGVLFSSATASALYRGLDISCGCFGADVGGPEGGGGITRLTVVRAAMVSAASLAALVPVLLIGRVSPRVTETEGLSIAAPQVS